MSEFFSACLPCSMLHHSAVINYSTGVAALSETIHPASLFNLEKGGGIEGRDWAWLKKKKPMPSSSALNLSKEGTKSRLIRFHFMVISVFSSTPFFHDSFFFFVLPTVLTAIPGPFITLPSPECLSPPCLLGSH